MPHYLAGSWPVDWLFAKSSGRRSVGSSIHVSSLEGGVPDKNKGEQFVLIANECQHQPHSLWQSYLFFARDVWVWSFCLGVGRYSNIATGCLCLLRWSFHSLQTCSGVSSQLPKCLQLCNCFPQRASLYLELVAGRRGKAIITANANMKHCSTYLPVIQFAPFCWTPPFPKKVQSCI